MIPVGLIHWHDEEAADLAAELTKHGFSVEAAPRAGPAMLRKLRESKPAAVVISLRRLPSHGREAAQAIRYQKATRQLPVIFFDGAPDKVEKLRQELPGCFFTTWEQLPAVIGEACRQASDLVAAPPSPMEKYAGRPLGVKLGLHPGDTLALVSAPPEVRGRLAYAVEDLTIVAGTGHPCRVLIWFIRSMKEMEDSKKRIAAQSKLSPVWIAWPKKTSHHGEGPSQQQIRSLGLAIGMVDYKICAIDETWSGLLFKWRGK